METYNIKIEEVTPEIMTILQYLSIQPGVRLLPENYKERSFQEAVAECRGVSVSVFFEELRSRINQWVDEHPEETENQHV